MSRLGGKSSDRGVKCGMNAVNGRMASDMFCDLSSGKNAVRSMEPKIGAS